MGTSSSSQKTESSASNNKVTPTKTKEGEDEVDTIHRRLKHMSSIGAQQFTDSLKNIHDMRHSIADLSYQDYEYPFENLVFEGGGAKGMVYIGCSRVLDEIGLKPKRYAGASAGAICAAMLAVGYTTAELEEFMSLDLEDILIDHSCGLCSLLPNMIRHFGWNPGARFLKVFGDLIAAKTGDPDTTFKQLFLQKGKELCVTAVNVNMLSVEYFHPKTSPNMSIRLAVRMSLSIPGIFQAVKLKNDQGEEDVFIDGGLLCNYPIHAFDGWWLSMNPTDSFLNRIQPLSQMHKFMDKRVRFGEYNEKTLGFLVYSSLEQEAMQTELESRVGVKIEQRPEKSKLYQSRKKALESKEQTLFEHQVFLHALDKFMVVLGGQNVKTLRKTNGDNPHQQDDVIDKEELKQALKEAMIDIGSADDQVDGQIGFDTGDIEILFGKNADLDSIFDELDADDSGFISYDELIQFVERSGVNIQAKFAGYNRKEVTSFGDYVVGLQECLLTNIKKMFLEERDLQRTVGINTDYIATTDFHMEDCDKDFCIERGRDATVAFLKHYIHENRDTIRRTQRAGGGIGVPQTQSEATLNSPNSTRSTTSHLKKTMSLGGMNTKPLPSMIPDLPSNGLAALPPIRGQAKYSGLADPNGSVDNNVQMSDGNDEMDEVDTVVMRKKSKKKKKKQKQIPQEDGEGEEE